LACALANLCLGHEPKAKIATALAKPLGGIKLIAMGEVLYQVVNKTLCFKL